MEEDQGGEKITCLRAYQIAVGKLGVDPAYFLHKMSVKQFNNLLIGYNEKYEEEHNKWRKLVYYIAKPNFSIGAYEDFEALRKDPVRSQKSTRERFEGIVKLFKLDKKVKLEKKDYGVR